MKRDELIRALTTTAKTDARHPDELLRRTIAQAALLLYYAVADVSASVDHNTTGV